MPPGCFFGDLWYNDISFMLEAGMGGIILGNIFSLLAMGTDTFSASRKSAKGVLLAQVASQFFYGASAFALKGYSAVVQNVVSIFRNLAALYPRCPKWIYWVLVAAGLGFGIAFNNLGLIGWLPIVANLMYALTVIWAKGNALVLKIAFLILTLMFGVFNLAILNFVGAAGNVVIVVTTAVYIIKALKEKIDN